MQEKKNIIKKGLYLIVSPAIGLVQDNMLTNVTNKLENRQLFKFTCFIIHVGLDRIGVNAYA